MTARREAQYLAAYDDVLSPIRLVRARAEAVLGMTRAMSRREIEGQLQGIVRSLAQLDQQMHNIMSSRLLAEGGMEVEWQDVDLSGIVRSLAQEYRKLYGPWRVKTFVERALPSVLGDPARVEQALANLMDDALRYSPSDCAISVGARRQPGPAAALTSNAVDNTPVVGIWVHCPADTAQAGELEDVFEASQTEDLAVLLGDGLGLHVCRRIVKAHGGRLVMDSRPRQGVTFLFYLPVGGGPKQLHLWDGGLPGQCLPLVTLAPDVPDTVA
ncbi:MAG: hypothetical protein HYY01_06130 [Chloroflexi bacterium]|nr:hypothetical protein [Chloroflexota bacterium]